MPSTRKTRQRGSPWRSRGSVSVIFSTAFRRMACSPCRAGTPPTMATAEPRESDALGPWCTSAAGSLVSRLVWTPMTLIVGRAPLSPQDLATLRETTARLGFSILVDPGQTAASPALKEIMDAADIVGLTALSAKFHLDVSPPTDESPVFLQSATHDRSASNAARHRVRSRRDQRQSWRDGDAPDHRDSVARLGGADHRHPCLPIRCAGSRLGSLASERPISS